MEEQALVRLLKNNSISIKGATHAEATKFVHDTLRVWEHLVKQCKGGQAYILVDFRP